MTKVMLAFGIAVVVACDFSAAEQPEADAADTFRGGWLDVTAGGTRYYGLYVSATKDGEVVYCSGVVLMPWNDRPPTSVSYRDGKTVLKLEKVTITAPGQPLVFVDSDGSVSFITYDVPNALQDCLSREAMQKKVKALIQNTMKSVPSSDDTGS